MAEEKPQEVESSFADRVSQTKEEAKKKLFEKRKEAPPQFQLSEMEVNLAKRIVPFLSSDAAKAMLEFEQLVIISNSQNPFSPPHEMIFKSADFGEQMAFKHGFLIGLSYHKAQRETLVKMYLEIQEQESKKKEGLNGSKDE